MKSGRFLSAIAAVVIAAGSARAATLANPDFAGPVILLGDVTRNPLSSEPASTWILGGGDNADAWVHVAQKAVNDASGSEAQGMYQWLVDNKATAGPGMIKFDLNFQSGAGDTDLHLYVFGWNNGDNAPGSDLENGTADTGDSFIPDDSVSLISEITGAEGRLVLVNNGSPAFTGVTDGGGFQTIVANLNFNGGFDNLGVLFYGENSGGLMEIDNVQFMFVPEPATASLAMLGLAGLMLRRNRGNRARPQVA